MLHDAGSPYIKHKERLEYQESFVEEVTKLAAEYGVDTENITDFDLIVAAVPEETLAVFAEEAFGIFNVILKDMAVTIYAVPVVTVGEMKAVDGSTEIGAPTQELESYFKDTYIVVTGIEDDSKIDESETDDSKTDESESDNNNNAGNTDSNPTESPKTGDIMNIATMNTMLAVAVMLLLTFAVVFRRNRYIK